MSGLEIFAGIVGVIDLIDKTTKIYETVKKNVNLHKTFYTVADQLPLLREILETCKMEIKPIEATLPPLAKESLNSCLESCESKLNAVKHIFERIEETRSTKGVQWYNEYVISIRNTGKAKRVEDLLRAFTEEVSTLLKLHAVKSASPSMGHKLQEIIQKLAAVEPSAPDPEEIKQASQTFNSFGEEQLIHNGHGGTVKVIKDSGMDFSGPGNHTLHFGKPLP